MLKNTILAVRRGRYKAIRACSKIQHWPSVGIGTKLAVSSERETLSVNWKRCNTDRL